MYKKLQVRQRKLHYDTLNSTKLVSCCRRSAGTRTKNFPTLKKSINLYISLLNTMENITILCLEQIEYYCNILIQSFTYWKKSRNI